jgi:hypothetical protein
VQTPGEDCRELVHAILTLGQAGSKLHFGAIPLVGQHERMLGDHTTDAQNGIKISVPLRRASYTSPKCNSFTIATVTK